MKAPNAEVEVDEVPKTNLTSPMLLVPGAAVMPPQLPTLVEATVEADEDADVDEEAGAEVEVGAVEDDATLAAGEIIAALAPFHTNDGCAAAAVLDGDCFANSAVLGLALLRLNPPMNAGAAVGFAAADEATAAGRTEDGEDDNESSGEVSAEDAEDVLATVDNAFELLLNSGAVGLLL